jgi:ribosomal protein S18 acetylase RimI-like enzyme
VKPAGLIRNMKIRIRPMEKADVPALARLHADVFEGYNSTALGAAYLKRLYRTLASHASCLSVVAEEGGEIVAWIGGIKDYAGYNRALVRSCLHAAPPIVLSALCRRPRLLGTGLMFVWRVLTRGPKRRRAPAEEPPLPGVETSPGPDAHLLVIGVAVGRQRGGIGQVIMAEFHQRLAAVGFTRCGLSTYADNDAGNKAFVKAGYKLLNSTADVNYYIKYLTGEGEMKP